MTHPDNKNLEYKRFYSHIFQIYLARKLNSKEILEIGKGDGFVYNLLRKGIETDLADAIRKSFSIPMVTTIDNDRNKSPHRVIDITDLEELDSLPNNFYDTILICEVLEHVPYEKVEEILKILKKKTNKYIIISVPDQSKYLRAQFFKHGIRDVHFFMSALNWVVRKFNRFWDGISKIQYRFVNKRRQFKKQKEHHWELGIDKYSVKNFRDMLEQNFKIILDERVKEFPWHHFFIIKKEN